MTRSFLTLSAAALAAIFAASPALSAPKTCVIVYSGGTNGNWQEKEEHEFAHALGWQHPTSPLLIARYKSANGGKSFQVQERYKKLYRAWKAGEYEPPCKLTAYYTTVAEAKRVCGGHFGCQWFE